MTTLTQTRTQTRTQTLIQTRTETRTETQTQKHIQCATFTHSYLLLSSTVLISGRSKDLYGRMGNACQMLHICPHGRVHGRNIAAIFDQRKQGKRV